MAIFFNKDVHELLQNRKVIVIGDSIQRSVYKDLVCLWTQQDSRYLRQRELRAKGELSFLGDKLLSGGKLEGKMVNGVGYREVREFSDSEVSFKYYFVTRSYSEHMASILNELKTYQPDIIVMNSTFWDLHHYGDSDLQQYKANLDKLLNGITEMFASSMLFIWNAALPLAERCKGGFLRKGFLTIPVDKIKTANKFAWLATTERKKIYLDLFTELKNKESFTQAEDGIHWGMRAHRKISNLILTEVCTSWNKKVPDAPPLPNKVGNVNSSPVPWSSFYPDNGEDDNWNSPLPPSYMYNDDYEVEYFVPYWASPILPDRYQTPSPFNYGPPSPYGNSWGNYGVNYNAPFISERAREFQPIHLPVPYPFPSSHPPVNLNFGTPQLPLHQGKYMFKPASYSAPLPSRSINPFITNQFRSLPAMSQGLLPTPPGRPSYPLFTVGSSSYRDRFKKLSNPSVRGRRYRPSTSTRVSTPLHTAQNSKQSETPQNSLVNHRASTPAVNGSDLNNNEQQKSSVSEPSSELNKDNAAAETGVPHVPNAKSSTDSTTPGEGSEPRPTVNGEDKSDSGDGDKTRGIKRKHEDDEVENVADSNPSKVARWESTITDVSRSGLKRKLEDDEPAQEPNVAKNVQENCEPSDDAESCGLKRRRADDGTALAVEAAPSQSLQTEKSIMDNSKDQHEETPFTAVSKLTDVTLDKGTVHDLVRCSLTYDSFI